MISIKYVNYNSIFLLSNVVLYLMNNKYELIYEGKAKKVFSHDDLDKVIIEFKDDATAFNALKKAKFELSYKFKYF